MKNLAEEKDLEAPTFNKGGTRLNIGESKEDALEMFKVLKAQNFVPLDS